MFHKDNHASNLPDAYRKDSESNHFKLLETERLENERISQRLQEINRILDLNQATGRVLDDYGQRLGQPRGKATDSQYLLMLKAKIMRNLSNGTSVSYTHLAHILNFVNTLKEIAKENQLTFSVGNVEKAYSYIIDIHSAENKKIFSLVLDKEAKKDFTSSSINVSKNAEAIKDFLTAFILMNEEDVYKRQLCKRFRPGYGNRTFRQRENGCFLLHGRGNLPGSGSCRRNGRP